MPFLFQHGELTLCVAQGELKLCNTRSVRLHQRDRLTGFAARLRQLRRHGLHLPGNIAPGSLEA